MQCWWTDTLCTTPKQPYLAKDMSTCNEPGTWGLSVDDGPNPTDCHLYTLFQQNNLRPSLFYIGSQGASWALPIRPFRLAARS